MNLEKGILPGYIPWILTQIPGQVIALTNEIRRIDGKEYYEAHLINQYFTSIFKYNHKTGKYKIKKGKEEVAELLNYNDQQSNSENIERWLDIFKLDFEYEYKIYNFNDLYFEATIVDHDGQEFAVKEFGSFVCANGKMECQATPSGDVIIEVVDGGEV